MRASHCTEKGFISHVIFEVFDRRSLFCLGLLLFSVRTQSLGVLCGDIVFDLGALPLGLNL